MWIKLIKNRLFKKLSNQWRFSLPPFLFSLVALLPLFFPFFFHCHVSLLLPSLPARPINGGRKERKKAVASQEEEKRKPNQTDFFPKLLLHLNLFIYYVLNQLGRSDTHVGSPKHAHIFFLIKIYCWLGGGGGGRWGDDNQEYKITAAALLSYSVHVVGSPQIRLSCCSVDAGAGREMSWGFVVSCMEGGCNFRAMNSRMTID